MTFTTFIIIALLLTTWIAIGLFWMLATAFSTSRAWYEAILVFPVAIVLWVAEKVSKVFDRKSK